MLLDEIKNTISNLELSFNIDGEEQKIVLLDSYIYKAEIIENTFYLVVVLPFFFNQLHDIKDCLEKDILAALSTNKKSSNLSLNLDLKTKIYSHKTQKDGLQVGKVKNIISIASGKGGVGKSTVTAGLALSLQKQGAKVGILDADIYGPSQGEIFELDSKPEVVDGKLIPILKNGIKIMSMSALVDKDSAMIWRGPMVSSAINQFVFQTEWGELDYLFLDLPPGTGDIQLTMVQKIPVTAAVIVTTPHMLALADAKRAVNMFNKVNIEVIGVTENMSYFSCEKCSHISNIFNEVDLLDNKEFYSENWKLPVLGKLPMIAKFDLLSPNQLNLFDSLGFKLQLAISKIPRNMSFGISTVQVN